jgi:outer membrane protease
MGLLFGQANEYVYNQDVSANYKNSELMWPFQPLYYTSARLDLESRGGLFANLEVRQGFAGRSGSMTDSDFLNGDGVRTHFSQSDCYTERALLLDLSLGYEIPMGDVMLGAYGGLSYMDLKWSARDGYYQYPSSGSDYYFDSTSGALIAGTYQPWSSAETKTPIYGTGILYEQSHLNGLLGLRVSYRLLDALLLRASCSFSPFATCTTTDNHLERSLNFTSSLKGGVYVEPRLSLSYYLSPGASFELFASYTSVTNLIGDLTQTNEGVTYTSSDQNYYAGPGSASTSAKGAGAYLSAIDAGLSFRLAF